MDYKINYNISHDNLNLTGDKLIVGINKICDIIKPTFGCRGSNVVVEHALYPFHQVVNDGKTIVDAIKLADPIENIGANILREVSDKAEIESGDGRKTTMLLTQAIVNEGTNVNDPLKTKENTLFSAMDIKRSLDECLPIIQDSIDKQTKQITPEELAPVASVAAESESLGKLFQDIYTQIGKDGIVELDNSHTFKTTYEIKEGVRLRNCGFVSPYMQTEQDKAVYKKPKILITKQKIATLTDIDPIFQKISKEGPNEIVIFCDEIDLSVLSALMYTHVKGIFKTLIIQAPKLWKDWIYEDFALITGATIVEPASGLTLKSVELSHLGTCEKIITTREDTTVIGIKDVSSHIERLNEDALNDSQLKLRASWLQTKAAVLKLGANSESELSYVSKKAKDGRNASYLALNGGVVAGGGIALYNASETLPDTIGGRILKEALKFPVKQIMHNMNFKKEDMVLGIDTFGENVLDPATVVKNAVKNAISVAGIVLTANAVITLNKDKAVI